MTVRFADMECLRWHVPLLLGLWLVTTGAVNLQGQALRQIQLLCPELEAAANWDNPDLFCSLSWTFCDNNGGVTSLTIQSVDCKSAFLSQFTTPLTALPQLYKLGFQYANVRGPLPAGWSALTSLGDLTVNNWGVAGTLPSSWSALINLRSLNLNGNGHTGSLPSTWSSLVNLAKLNLANNQLAGALPSSWSTLTKVDQLLLSNNLLVGPLPGSWSSWTLVTDIELYSNPLGGTLPSSWGAMTNLISLSLQLCQLQGTLPPQWSGMSRLYDLTLIANNLSGPLPSSWSSLPLSQFSAGFNRLNGTLPASWGLSGGTRNIVSLENNQLSGPLPSSWGQVAETLVLRNNLLSGQLPSGLFTSGVLQFLNLDNNAISGTVPNFVGTTSSVGLGGNRIGGSLPEWRNFVVNVVALNNNLLVGTIPSFWAQKLGFYPSLFGNQLCGGVPAGLNTFDQFGQPLSLPPCASANRYFCAKQIAFVGNTPAVTVNGIASVSACARQCDAAGTTNCKYFSSLSGGVCRLYRNTYTPDVRVSPNGNISRTCATRLETLSLPTPTQINYNVTAPGATRPQSYASFCVLNYNVFGTFTATLTSINVTSCLTACHTAGQAKCTFIQYKPSTRYCYLSSVAFAAPFNPRAAPADATSCMISYGPLLGFVFPAVQETW